MVPLDFRVYFENISLGLHIPSSGIRQKYI